MSKHILVLARRDAYEALRVAAGLTIRNNTVDFIFMCEPARTPQGTIAHLDMLQLADITPHRLGVDLDGIAPCDDLAPFLARADQVVSF